MMLNYFVHSIMYSYYVLKAMRYKIPKFISILITYCTNNTNNYRLHYKYCSLSIFEKSERIRKKNQSRIKTLYLVYLYILLILFSFVISFTNLILIRTINLKRKLIKTKNRIKRITSSKLIKNTRNISKFYRNFYHFLVSFKNLLIMKLHLKK